MFLKNISLYGFKTFALKTDFVFKPGITAIVGPNGCGKSNLFDSIIWVLGEQNARSIRGVKMEDIIFHGSESKKGLGFAQVGLTFDNDDGYFQLPHSEISITRRFFKSGDSEFEINGQSCRLKDIHSLLMDTGMGKLNYSIITQGDIEYIIGLSPTDRRTVFDEAAGINKYKAEKKKTLQKIKDTDNNILRLRDLLVEIEERLGPLEEQARKAKRHEELLERIEQLKMRVIVSDIRRVLGAIEEQNTAEKATREEISAAEEGIAKTRQAREARRGDLTQAHAAVSAAGQTLGQLSGTLENHEQSLRFIQNSIEQARKSSERAAAEMGGADVRIKELENEISDLGLKKQAAAADIERLKAELQKALPKETADFDNELEHEKKLREQAAAARAEADLIREQLENLRFDHRQAADRLLALRESHAEKSRDMQKAEKQLDALDEKHTRISAELSAAEKQRDDAKARLEKLQADSEASEKARAELRSSLEAARENLSYQRARAEYLQAMSKAAASKEDAAPEKWVSLSKGEAHPIKLKTKAGFEPAARRALGAVLGAWMIEGAASIKSITCRRAGEMIFAVSDLLASSGQKDSESFRGKSGVLGLLSDFVSPDDAKDSAGSKAAAKLLSRFVVVEDSAKLAELATGLKPGVALVTKTGDALLSDGLLQLGEGIGGLEDLKAQCDEAREAVRRFAEEANALEKKLSDANRAAQSASGELKNCESAIQKAAMRAVELESALRNIASEQEFHDKNLEALRESVDKMDATRSDLELGDKTMSGQLKSFEERLAVQKQEYEKSEKILADLLESRRAAQAAIQELRIGVSRREKEIESIEENIVYRGRDIERARERRAELEAEKKRLEEEYQARAAEYDSTKQQGAALAERVVSARQALVERQTAIQNIEKEITAFGQEIGAAERAAAELRDKMLQGQLKRARYEAQLEEARRVFSEEFPETEEAKALEETAPMAPGEKSEYKSLKDELESLGLVNMLAIGEFEDEKARYDLLYSQIADLEETRATLVDMVNNFDEKSRDQFLETFSKINEKFKETFVEVWEGGDCEISLTDANRPLECGVEIGVQIPGKRMRSISLLSGGEKALCALTLIFAILKVKPSPFYLLDEVDAGLDEGNVAKFKRMMRKYSKDVQFFIVTHNKSTLLGADHYYGITLNENDGFTRVLSVSLEKLHAGSA